VGSASSSSSANRQEKGTIHGDERQGGIRTTLGWCQRSSHDGKSATNGTSTAAIVHECSNGASTAPIIHWQRPVTTVPARHHDVGSGATGSFDAATCLLHHGTAPTRAILSANDNVHAAAATLHDNGSSSNSTGGDSGGIPEPTSGGCLATARSFSSTATTSIRDCG